MSLSIAQPTTAAHSETGSNLYSELKASREPRLTAKWLLVNNKLVCQWMIN